MITAIIRSVIRFRWLVWARRGVWSRSASYALRTAPLDAIPDISDPQIIVYSKWPRSPLLIETEVTEPIIRALAGSPDIQSIRGTSHMGYSFIYVILRDAGPPGGGPAVRRRPPQRHPLAASRRRQRRRSAPMPAASAGFSNTRWSTGSARATCGNCGC